MKITIDTECTPEEARRFLGLPDLSPVHDAYVAKLQRLIEEGRDHLLLDTEIRTHCPVHILQGMEDPDVPHPHAFKILARLPKAGIVLTLIADGDHRLSRPQDIARLIAAVAEIP